MSREGLIRAGGSVPALLWSAALFVLPAVFTLEWIAGQVTRAAVYPFPWQPVLMGGVLSTAPLLLHQRFANAIVVKSSQILRAFLISIPAAAACEVVFWSVFRHATLFDQENPGAAPYPWRGLLYVGGILAMITLGVSGGVVSLWGIPRRDRTD